MYVKLKFFSSFLYRNRWWNSEFFLERSNLYLIFYDLCESTPHAHEKKISLFSADCLIWELLFLANGLILKNGFPITIKTKPFFFLFLISCIIRNESFICLFQFVEKRLFQKFYVETIGFENLNMKMFFNSLKHALFQCEKLYLYD